MGGGGFGLTAEEARALNFAQIENMFRSADKMGNPIRKGARENLAIETESRDSREAEEAMRQSLRLTFESNKS